MLNSLSVPKKLLCSFAAMITICGVASGYVAWHVFTLQEATRLTDESMALTMASGRMQAAALEQQNAMRGYVASGAEEFVDQFDKAERAFEKDIQDLEVASASGDLRGAKEKLRLAQQHFKVEAQALIEMAKQPTARSDAGALVPTTARLTEIRKVLKAIEEQEAKDEEIRKSARTRAFGEVYLGIGIGGAIALALSLLLAWLLNNSLGRPVTALTTVMGRLAGGDNAVDVPSTERRDEIGRMAQAVLRFKDAAIEKLKAEHEVSEERAKAEAARTRTEAEKAAGQAEQQAVMDSVAGGLVRLAEGDLTYRLSEPFPPAYERLRSDFNSAIAQIEDAMRTIVDVSNGISSGSDEIAAAADDLARRTEQQAASLEQTAAALDEITATIRRSSAGASEAADAVGGARGEAERSHQVVQGAVAAMGEIENSSHQIRNIIGVIDEIAFQTNLLALNAGVEAARAGESGRGFAVVASEVRALAQRSAEAAKEIGALISSSSEQVGQGVVLVGQTGDTLTGIVGKVGHIDTLVREIATSAQEQSVGLQEVNTAVNQMDQVVQQNAAMVEQSTAASHALKNEVGRLRAMIGRFQVGGADHAPTAAAAPAPAVAERPRLKVAASGGGRTEQWEEF